MQGSNLHELVSLGDVSARQTRTLAERADALLRSKRFVPALLALTLALSMRALSLGRYLDDLWVFVNVKRGASPWSLCSVDRLDIARARYIGALPWWGSRDLGGKFIRPLASWMHYFELTHWPNAIWLMHLENVIAYCVLVWVATRLYRRLGLDTRSAALASLMFAVDDGHAMSVGWISARNTLLTAIFAFACVLAYVKGRQAEQPHVSSMSAVYLALALLCSESGVSGFAYVVAYALLLDKTALSARLRSMIPHLLVLGCWAALYLGMHAGARGTTLYRDLGAPWSVLGQGLLDLPVWIFALLGPSFANFSLSLPSMSMRVAALLLLVPLGLWVWPALRRHPLGGFFALGALLCVPPLFTTLPQDRLLIAASFGAFGLIACAFELLRQRSTRLRRWGAYAFAGMHLVLAPCLFVLGLSTIAWMARPNERVFDALQNAGGQEVVLLNAPSDWLPPAVFSMLYDADVRLPASFHQLYSGAGRMLIERLEPNSLEITISRGWGGLPYESMVSSSVRGLPRVGDVFPLANMRVRVLAATAEGLPERVRFEFPTPLEASARRWYVWSGKTLAAWSPPAVGERIELPPLNIVEAFLP
jgi:hypothetical protein